MRIKNLSLCLISVFFSLGIFSQTIDKKSSANELNTFYNQHVGKAAILYSGPAYVTLRIPMKGSPFLGSDTLTAGWISYDGQHYKDVLLQWDVLQNYVLTEALMKNVKMILRNDLIDSFSFAGHLVKFMPRDKENNLMNEGLYDILYAGSTPLLARRKKVIKEKLETNSRMYHISEKNTYYIKNKGIYHRVSNKKEVAYLFPKDMPAIKKAVRRNGLKWKKDLEQVLMIAVLQYDQTNTIK